jgi:type II secretory pathway pseudopilin PulG
MATHQPPAYATHAPPPPQGNGLAIAGLITGILSVVLCFLWFVGPILAILAIIFGAIGMSRAKKQGGRGKGAALAGLILGIVGIVLAIIVVAMLIFAASSLEYMKKSKKTEASIHLNTIEKRIKMFYVEKGRVPASTALMPPSTACESRTGKAPRQPRSVWETDPGWREIDFSIDEDTLFQYRWTQTGTNSGYIEAIGDLDCDTTLSTYRVDIDVAEGNLRATAHDPTPD